MSVRRPCLAAVFFAAVATAQFSAGQGGGGGDRVFYRDRAKDFQIASTGGDVQESAAGVKVLVGGKVKMTISPADVVRVEYASLPGFGAAERSESASLENREVKDAKDAAAGRDKYAAMIGKAGTDPKTKKFLEFREAVWAARAADAQAGDAFKAEAPKAVAKLTQFVQSYPKAWEVWPTARAAARLQVELNDHKAAALLLAALAKTADLPVELKYEAKLAELDAQFRTGNKLAAEPLLDELTKDTAVPPGPAKDKLAVFQAIMKAPTPRDGARPAELVQAVEAVIARTTDSGVRAAARNALGEFYFSHKMYRDAMWEFLWVETVFNQDRDEVAKAVARLAEVFKQLGDADRESEYKEKLPRVKAL